MDNIIKERLNQESSMGFKAALKDQYDEDENILQKVTVEDIRTFGMIPEFIGRLPILFSGESDADDVSAMTVWQDGCCSRLPTAVRKGWIRNRICEQR